MKIFRNKLHSVFIDLIFYVLAGLFAFGFVFFCGMRGFFAFDQSIVFDGAWRVLSGQVPYRDFVIPVGTVSFWIQALFFKIFGVSYFSYILPAALFNAICSLCSIYIVRCFFPDKKLLYFSAGVLTAIWLWPPYGTFYYDNLSFSFILLSLAVIAPLLKDFSGSTKKQLVRIFLCGCLAALIFLTKQNAGLFVLPFYYIILLSACRSNRKNIFLAFFIFSMGMLTAAGLFILWLFVFSNSELYLRYGIRIPADLGYLRFFKYFFYTVTSKLALEKYPFVMTVLSSGFIAAVFILLVNIFSKNNNRNNIINACTVTIYLYLYQFFFIVSTKNEAFNSLGFVGIIFSLSAALLIDFVKQQHGSFTYLSNNLSFKTPLLPPAGIKSFLNKRFLILLIGFVFVILSIRGGQIALTRQVHSAVKGAASYESFEIKPLKYLKWASPTRLYPEAMPEITVDKRHIDELYLYLKQKGKNFFIFPDFTIFYGLLKKTSPGPLVWFHEGLTYKEGGDSFLDGWLVEGLEGKRVEIIILESRPPYGYDVRLGDFPLFRDYVFDNFDLVNEIGIFHIYQKPEIINK
ncbi:MAG: glycosyltransferase family 39 protein [Candidatus Omnitrophota bacterium]